MSAAVGRIHQVSSDDDGPGEHGTTRHRPVVSTRLKRELLARLDALLFEVLDLLVGLEVVPAVRDRVARLRELVDAGMRARVLRLAVALVVARRRARLRGREASPAPDSPGCRPSWSFPCRRPGSLAGAFFVSTPFRGVLDERPMESSSDCIFLELPAKCSPDLLLISARSSSLASMSAFAARPASWMRRRASRPRAAPVGRRLLRPLVGAPRRTPARRDATGLPRPPRRTRAPCGADRCPAPSSPRACRRPAPRCWLARVGLLRRRERVRVLRSDECPSEPPARSTRSAPGSAPPRSGGRRTGPPKLAPAPGASRRSRIRVFAHLGSLSPRPTGRCPCRPHADRPAPHRRSGGT
jgi:hypothetical protein